MTMEELAGYATAGKMIPGVPIQATRSIKIAAQFTGYGYISRVFPGGSAGIHT